MIEIADLVLELDDKVTRKKAGTISLVFVGAHETEIGEFKLTYKVESKEIPSYWRALLGEGEFRTIYVTISSKSKQSQLPES